MGDKHLNAPIVSMAAAPGGGGYWLAASDGGVFAYGTSTFLGSMGGQHLNAPVVGMSAAAGGHGYLLIADDGGIFAYGDATFYGSMGGTGLSAAVVGVAGSAGAGYWLLGADGAIYSFGNAQYAGRALSPVGGSPAPSGACSRSAGRAGRGISSSIRSSAAPRSTPASGAPASRGAARTLGPRGARARDLHGGELPAEWRRAQSGRRGRRGRGASVLVVCPPDLAALQLHLRLRRGAGVAAGGAGFWPGFWLLATNGSSDEIDAMEADGNLPDQAILTYHYGSGEFKPVDGLLANYTAGWHTFAVDWEPGSITWYVDGMAAKTFTSPVVATTAMYAILDLAVSGRATGTAARTRRRPSPRR